MIKIASIFADNMLLQRQKPIRIWGTTDRKQNLRVLLNDKEIMTAEIADAFTIILPPQEAMEDAKLELIGDVDKVGFNHVDIGELFIAGGQSNMEFLLKQTIDAETEIANACDTHLRFYDVGEYSYEGEKAESPKDASGWDHWMCFLPENAGYFSAVGLYFAMRLRKKYGVPVGIIGCNWGGSSASCWLDESYLKEDAALRVYIDEYEKKLKKLDMKTYPDNYRRAQRAINSKAFGEIIEKASMGTMTFKDKLRLVPIAIKVLRSSATVGPYSEKRPSGLYHMMLRKVVRMAARGVIWYQGESDDIKASIYGKLFSQMVKCWRTAFVDELPFLTVQLAPFGKWAVFNGKKFPQIRKQQEWASKNIPGVHMICIMDDGDKNDIHPKNKRIVGERLAILAEGKIYGELGECESPAIDNVDVTDGRITLSFAHAKHLEVKGTHLQALYIKADGKALKDWSWTVDRNHLYISHNKISPNRKLSIQFAQEGYCQVNLYNHIGLPAFPFSVNC